MNLVNYYYNNMESGFSNKYKITLILLLGLIAFANIFSALNLGNASITVVGRGNITTQPGEVTMVVTSATIGNSAEDAISQGDIAINKLAEASKKIAGEGTDIKKSFYQVTPQGDGKFLMASAISIKSTNVSATNNLVKYLYANGATTVSNVSFNPKNDGVIEKQAQEAALKDAQKKAEDLAKSMGKKVGRIISIAPDSTDLTSSVSQGDLISLEKRTSVVYEIK